jgi:hypothetical protein
MNLYSNYLRKNILWLQDGFRHYYVQRPDLLHREIVDVTLRRFCDPEQAVDWLACCAHYDAFYTLLHLRSFLSEHSPAYEPVFRYDDRTVIHKVADLLGTNRHAIVERPKYLTTPLLVDPASIFAHILGQKPGDVYDWAQTEFTQNARQFAHPLTDGENAYLDHFGLERINPDKLTDQQTKLSAQLFGASPKDRAQYANWRSRARIANHYRYTHPANINGLMMNYRFARDSNVATFALERGWQIGSGKEMFTGLKVSRLQAGLELLLSIGVVKLLGLRSKPGSTAPAETQPGASSTRKTVSGPQTEPEAQGKLVDQKTSGGYTKELRKGISDQTISSESGKLVIEPGEYSASEIRAAEHMAGKGKNVLLRQPVGTRAAGGTSDLLVNGVRYDVYTPTTSNPSRIISAIAKKNTQAEGIVLDLSNSAVTPDQLGNVLSRVQRAGATNIKHIVIIGK